MDQIADYIELKRELGNQIKLFEEIIQNAAQVDRNIKMSEKLRSMEDRVRKYKIYIEFRRR